jgi:hypothetical protein
LPSSYDSDDEAHVCARANLIVDDYRMAEMHYFTGSLSVRDLLNRITEKPQDCGTGASISAMALAYLLDPNLAGAEIDVLAKLWPCEMTSKFVNYMKGIVVKPA